MKYLMMLSLFVASVANAGPQGFAYEGKLLDPSGIPVVGPVSFIVQIRSPGSEDCNLFEEQHNSVALANGYFSLNIGAGSRSGVSFHNTSSMPQVFSPSGTLSSLTCASGSTYSPVAADSRKLRVSFYDGAAWQTMTSDLVINSAPFAMVADSLQGKGPSSFLQPNTSGPALSQANLESVFASSSYVSELIALAAGTSTTYARSSGGSFSGPINITASALPAAPSAGAIAIDSADANKLKYYNGSAWQSVGTGSGNVASVSAGTGLSNSGTAAAPVLELSNTAVTAGSYGGASVVPTFSVDAQGRLTAVAAIAVNDSSKLPLSGAAMTGAIAMANNAITGLPAPTAVGDAVNKAYADAREDAAKLYADGKLVTKNLAVPAVGQDGQSIRWNNTAGSWEYFTAGGGGGSVTSVTSSNADISVSNSTTTPQLTLNVGSGPNQIVKLNSAGELPAVSGINLGSLSAGALVSGTIADARLSSRVAQAPTLSPGDDGKSLRWNDSLTAWEFYTPFAVPLGTLDQFIVSDGSNWVNTSLSSSHVTNALGFNPVNSVLAADWDVNGATPGGTIKLVGLADGSASDHSATTGQVNAAVAGLGAQYLRKDGTNLSAPLDLNGQPLQNVSSIRLESYGAQPLLDVIRSRGTVASPSALVASDIIGGLSMGGYDGGGQPISAFIHAVASQAWAPSSAHGSDLVFATAANSTATVPQVRMKITNTGEVGIGTNTPSAMLHVNGSLTSNSLTVNGAANFASTVTVNNGITLSGPTLETIGGGGYTGATFTMSLPSMGAVSHAGGVTIKCISTDGSGRRVTLIGTSGSFTLVNAQTCAGGSLPIVFDGTVGLTKLLRSVDLISDGTKWYALGH